MIPYIQKEFNPNIVSSLERLSDIAKEQEEYIQSHTAECYRDICIQEINVTENFEYNKVNGAEIIIDLKKFNVLD